MVRRQSDFVDEKVIEEGVERAAKALAPDVVRIRFNLGEDWTGDPCINFRILIIDKASRGARLREVAGRVRGTLTKEVEPRNLGFIPYFTFRNVTEQSELKEKVWE